MTRFYKTCWVKKCNEETTLNEYNVLTTFIGSFVYISVDHKQNKMVVMMNKCITAINLTTIFASLAFHGELMLSRNALKSRHRENMYYVYACNTINRICSKPISIFLAQKYLWAIHIPHTRLTWFRLHHSCWILCFLNGICLHLVNVNVICVWYLFH